MSDTETNLQMPGPQDGGQSTGQLSPRVEVESGGDQQQSLEMKDAPTKHLKVSASFDSEIDMKEEILSEPLHKESHSLAKSPGNESFEMADDMEFEILYDDDAGDEAFTDYDASGELEIDGTSKPTESTGRNYDSPYFTVRITSHDSIVSLDTFPKVLVSNNGTKITKVSEAKKRHSIGGEEEVGNVDAKGNRFRLFAKENDGPKSPTKKGFKGIRARAIAAYKGAEVSATPSAEHSLGTEDWVQDDGSSSEESSFADDLSSDDESGVFDDGIDGTEQVIDFSSMAPIPTTFLDVPPDLFDYLHPTLVKNIDDQDMSTFAQEHYLLVKGLLQLLAERDLVGVEDDVRKTSNIIKVGPLKKKTSRGLWLVKFVEIRRGNLSYFADSLAKVNVESRKTIHLRKQTCRCVASKESSGNNFIFELLIEGGRTSYWMAKSEEERQAWIRTINQAMVGVTEGFIDEPVDLSLYQTPIEAYKSVHEALQQVETKQDYLVAVDSLLYRKSSSSALRVPMSWIREEVIQREDVKKDSSATRVKTSVSDFLKGLSATSVEINGALIEKDTVYSAERVIGALSRCILEYDRVDDIDGESEYTAKSLKRADKNTLMSELEAVSYARSILAGILRSTRQGDMMSALQNLMDNEKVAKVELESSEPLCVDVSFAGDDFSEADESHYDMSGWIETRSKRSRGWKERYFVISEGVLSYFEHAEPRPYGLRGQIALGGAAVTTIDSNTIQIQTNREERLLRFEDRGKFVKWKTFVEKLCDPEFSMATSAEHESPHPRRKKRTSLANVKPLKTASDTSAKVRQRAMKAMKKIKSARGMLKRGRHRRKDRRSSDAKKAMLMMSTRTLSMGLNQKSDPTVQAVIETNSVYNVLPVSDAEAPEPLLVVRVKLYQAFLLSGGVNGRLSRGDELLEMEFVGNEDADHEFLEAPTAL